MSLTLFPVHERPVEEHDVSDHHQFGDSEHGDLARGGVRIVVDEHGTGHRRDGCRNEQEPAGRRIESTQGPRSARGEAQRRQQERVGRKCRDPSARSSEHRRVLDGVSRDGIAGHDTCKDRHITQDHEGREREECNGMAAR
jgi:hypothetical protein